jgi:hypothetical protein
MRITAYILSFITFTFLAVGIIFKVQHWPGSSLVLTAGYLFSAFAGLFILLHKRKERIHPTIEKKPSNDSILDA